MTATITSTGPRTWEQLWSHQPDPDRDDAWLLREERNPRWQIVHDALMHQFGTIAGLRTVEMGSGRGDLSLLLARRGARVTLVDYSDKALAQAARRFDRWNLPAKFVKADILNMPGRHRSFYDVSCSLGVVEHFPRRQRAASFAAHRRMLCAGGMSIISVPHAACITYRLWKAYLEMRGWWPYGLEMPYTKGEMTALSRRAGFGETEIHCGGFWQSIADHWINTLRGRSPDWSDRTSLLDGVFGSTLTMLAYTHRIEPSCAC